MAAAVTESLGSFLGKYIKMIKDIATIMIALVISCTCKAEVLVIKDSLELHPHKFALNERIFIDVKGVYTNKDTIYAATSEGIIARFSRKNEWKKLFPCAAWSGVWRKDYERAKNESIPFNPAIIWHDEDNDRLLIFDYHVMSFFALANPHSENRSLTLMEPPDNKYYISHFCPQKEVFLYGLDVTCRNKTIGISKPDFSAYRRMFKIDCDLIQRLSLMSDYFHVKLAYNTKHSNIWVALSEYNNIYIIDTTGNLLDSITINADDFRLPQPPRSRIVSQAVLNDWLSNCTPIFSFHYVSSGYFLMQYYSDYVQQGSDSIRLSPTLCWTADGDPVELEVDKLWRLIQAQPDGRIFFAEYIYEDDTYVKTVVYVTRIEP